MTKKITRKTPAAESLEQVETAQQTVTDLVARLTKTRTAVTGLEAEVRASGTRNRIDEAALALLDGGDGPVAVETRVEALKRAKEEVQTVERAIQLAQKRVNDARSRAGQALGAEKRDEYVKIVTELAEALARVDEIGQREVAFRDAMTDETGGESWTTAITPLGVGGKLTSIDDQSWLSMWFKEAKVIYGIEVGR